MTELLTPDEIKQILLEACEKFVTDDHLYFLDLLRDTGVTNMFGARPFLLEAYPDLSKDEAAKVLTYWMETFGDRHPQT